MWRKGLFRKVGRATGGVGTVRRLRRGLNPKPHPAKPIPLLRFTLLHDCSLKTGTPAIPGPTSRRREVCMEPWEIHPALVHFPIAFLLGAVAYDLDAWRRGDPGRAA